MTNQPHLATRTETALVLEFKPDEKPWPEGVECRPGDEMFPGDEFWIGPVVGADIVFDFADLEPGDRLILDRARWDADGKQAAIGVIPKEQWEAQGWSDPIDYDKYPMRHVYSGVGFRTDDDEFFGICMRDSGYEFNYGGSWWSAQGGRVEVLRGGSERPDWDTAPSLDNHSANRSTESAEVESDE